MHHPLTFCRPPVADTHNASLQQHLPAHHAGNQYQLSNANGTAHQLPLPLTQPPLSHCLLAAPSNSQKESSAPRRQLDGGVSPTADGRGGGQARP
jgi:hypothetical protein